MPAAADQAVVRHSRAPLGVWASRYRFVIAALAGTLWLNNLYQLPVLASQHGGLAFISVYLLGLAFIGYPLMIAELALGQRARANPAAALGSVAQQVRRSRGWQYLGLAAALTSLLVLSYYAVVGGWALAHLARALFGGLRGLTIDGMNSVFATFVADPEKQLFWFTLFVAMTYGIVARGLHRGTEWLTGYGVPLLAVLLLLLCAYAATRGAFFEGAAQFLNADFSKLKFDGVVLALGQAFFSLSLAFGVMLAYGAHLPADAPIARLAFFVIAADGVVALLAGLAIFPLLQASGTGVLPGLATVFQSLPVTFDPLPAGGLMRTVFALTAVLIMWLSAVAFAEPMVLWVEERFHLARSRAAIWCAGLVWGLGVVGLLSFNYFSFEFNFFGVAKAFGFFDLLLVITNLILPFVAMLTALFVGWSLSRVFTKESLHLRSLCSYDIWVWCLRIVTPLLLLLIVFHLPRIFL